jgi:3-methyladenine DNA glycosylase AlkD
MARYGISSTNTLGISAPVLRQIARRHRRDHLLALALWDSGVHEARILAALVDDPKQVTRDQAERWVLNLDSWDVCDALTCNLLDRTAFAWELPAAWATREEEFVRRAAFSLIAGLTVHDKKAPDERFLDFLPLIEAASGDDRNFVKKAVNWALRQIGKRSHALNAPATELALALKTSSVRPARWIGSDAWRELTSPAVHARLKS